VKRAITVLSFGLSLVAAAGMASASLRIDPAAFAFRPHPGARLPLGVRLLDEHGSAVTFGEFFGKEPVVVVLEYLRCKSLCGLTLENTVAALDALPLDAGRDFQMLAISIDPRDKPADLARAKAKYLALYHHLGAADGIHFLAGSVEAVRQIADTIGFPYRFDPDTGQYIHPAGFILAGRDGRISRYIFGVGPAESELRDGLADAARGETLSPLERLVLLCHIEGTPLGRYTVPVVAALMIGNIAVGTTLIFIFAAIMRRRHG
jgi:protein SCO1/2